MVSDRGARVSMKEGLRYGWKEELELVLTLCLHNKPRLHAYQMTLMLMQIQDSS